MIVSTMMGVSVSFTIPYTLGVVDFRQHKSLFLGILCGIVVIPIGCFVAGIVLGISFVTLMVDLIPLLMFSGLLAWGLFKYLDVCVKIFSVFGFAIRGLITAGLVIGIIHFLTGNELVSPMSSLEESIMVCVNASVVLSGAFVFGAHLAFTTAFDPEYVPAMIVGKLVAGVLALLVANYIYERKK